MKPSRAFTIFALIWIGGYYALCMAWLHFALRWGFVASGAGTLICDILLASSAQWQFLGRKLAR